MISKQEYYNFSLNDEGYNRLMELWRVNNYNEKLTPSLDRIDKTRGFVEDNLRWVTNSEQSRFNHMPNIDVKKELINIFGKLPRITKEVLWANGTEYFYAFMLKYRNDKPKRVCYKFRKDEKGTKIWDIKVYPYRPVTTEAEIQYISRLISKERINNYS